MVKKNGSILRILAGIAAIVGAFEPKVNRDNSSDLQTYETQTVSGPGPDPDVVSSMGTAAQTRINVSPYEGASRRTLTDEEMAEMGKVIGVRGSDLLLLGVSGILGKGYLQDGNEGHPYSNLFDSPYEIRVCLKTLLGDN